jgi:hypothetical protein
MFFTPLDAQFQFVQTLLIGFFFLPILTFCHNKV